MSPTTESSRGRTAMLICLGLLVLTVCVSAYVVIAKQTSQTLPPGGVSSAEQAQHIEENSRRVAFALTILLIISSFLILLYAFGAILMIRAGRLFARGRVGGRPTDYVDVWASYRLTDEQISAATAERRRDDEDGPRKGSDVPPTDPEPDEPTAED